MSEKKTAKYKSWPFKEAQRIIKAFGRERLPQTAVLQTGYGPSGLPHIGTFAEIARTTWVRQAYEKITGGRTRLIAFSDDLDGLRKVPDNLPHGEMLAEHLGKPLSDIPDPYGCCESFSDHMIGNLKKFLDRFGFDAELRSASVAYRQGDFNDGITRLLHKVDDVLGIILPTMKEENRAGWSPFLPKCAACGNIYTTRVTAYHKDDLEIDYVCDGEFGGISGCGRAGTVSVLNGGAKMGWKVDWALRWFAYGVNYEMYGKDLIPSADLSARIVRVMGGRPPVGFFYEMFLDEKGEKISKSKGNGVSVEEWLQYAPVESLAHFIFRDPRQAKKLYLDMIPRTMDEYLEHLRRWPDMAAEKRPDAPLWHIHNAGASVPEYQSAVNFSMVNNLISALGRPDRELVSSFIKRYDARAAAYPHVVDSLVEKGIDFYKDRILPFKKYRDADEVERGLFLALKGKLAAPGAGEMSEGELQSLVFDVAREADVEPRRVFSAIYQVLLGQEQGPRFGTFAKLVGVERVIELISEKVGSAQ